MIPALAIMDFHVSLSQVISPLNLCNLLFLGLGASALCFVTWNLAVKILGSVRTSVYTVSYTHLDVYKRQAHCFLGNLALQFKGGFLGVPGHVGTAQEVVKPEKGCPHFHGLSLIHIFSSGAARSSYTIPSVPPGWDALP